MARPGVTYLEVAKAASTFQHQGENPTIDSIRRALGGGSNTTISAHLKKWRLEHQPTAVALSETTIPPDLLMQLESLWEALKAKSQESVDKIKLEQAQQSEEHQKIIDNLTDQLRQLKSTQQQVTYQHEKTKQQLKEAQACQAQTEQSLQDSTHSINEYKQRLADKQSAIDDLKEQTRNIQRNLEHFREAAHQQKEELSLQYNNEQSLLKQQIEHFTQQLNEAHKKGGSLSIALEQKKYHCEKLTDQTEWIKQQSQERYQTIQDLKSQIESLVNERESLVKQNNCQSVELAKQQQRIVELEMFNIEYKERLSASQAAQTQQNALVTQLLKDQKNSAALPLQSTS